MHNRVQANTFAHADLSFLVPDREADHLPLELQELWEQYRNDCQNQFPADHAAASSDWPVSLFVPQRYEENYAYPLLIWFHDDHSSENELDLVMNAIGDQNYCGLAIRGNTELPGHDSFGWKADDLEFGTVPLTQLVNITTRRLRRAFHINSERIFAAGSGTGADIALRLFTDCPQWFAGAVLIDPVCRQRLTLRNQQDLRGKPILHTASRTAADETLACNLDTVRLLRSAGVDVDVRITDDTLDPCSNAARFIDSWLMSRLNCVSYV
ncbi:MAG: hypothetical protein KDA89_24270 [Planctomycetaceae bacterium]|nr:hypothetical protein [Planctomycetaceae bacterium]